MPARFTAYPPDRAALVRVLDDAVVYRIGRANQCELCIDHFSVSRFHAELSYGAQAWRIHDTGSKNGLRIDGRMANALDIAKSTWLAVGDVYCWVEPMDAAEAALHQAAGQIRRATSRALSERLLPKLGVAALIPQTLEMVLELSGLERGFVLYAELGEPMRVQASHGIATQDIARTGFSGSAAAIERVLASGQSVICCDTDDSPWLGSRPSVRLGGIRALMCVPLRLSDTSMGAIYLDSRTPGPAITELDLELIENVAQQAASALAAVRLQGEVDQLLKQAADAGFAAPRWDELRAPSDKTD
jgi:GAF domain-containing protein